MPVFASSRFRTKPRFSLIQMVRRLPISFQGVTIFFEEAGKKVTA